MSKKKGHPFANLQKLGKEQVVAKELAIAYNCQEILDLVLTTDPSVIGLLFKPAKAGTHLLDLYGISFQTSPIKFDKTTPNPIALSTVEYYDFIDASTPEHMWIFHPAADPRFDHLEFSAEQGFGLVFFGRNQLMPLLLVSDKIYFSGFNAQFGKIAGPGLQTGYNRVKRYFSLKAEVRTVDQTVTTGAKLEYPISSLGEPCPPIWHTGGGIGKIAVNDVLNRLEIRDRDKTIEAIATINAEWVKFLQREMNPQDTTAASGGNT